MSDDFPRLSHDRELQNGFEDLLRAFEIIYDEYEKEHAPSLDKEFLHMNRHLWAQEAVRLFDRLYAEPNLDTSSMPEWIQEISGAVRRVAVRLRQQRDVTEGEAHHYFEGGATMLAVAVEQMRQVKKYRRSPS
jgi:hypothetical protein